MFLKTKQYLLIKCSDEKIYVYDVLKTVDLMV